MKSGEHFILLPTFFSFTVIDISQLITLLFRESQILIKDYSLVSKGLLLLLSCFSRVQLCETPRTAAHQTPPSLGFSRQEHLTECYKHF